jgi:hypothetical protein
MPAISLSAKCMDLFLRQNATNIAKIMNKQLHPTAAAELRSPHAQSDTYVLL